MLDPPTVEYRDPRGPPAPRAPPPHVQVYPKNGEWMMRQRGRGFEQNFAMAGSLDSLIVVSSSPQRVNQILTFLTDLLVKAEALGAPPPIPLFPRRWLTILVNEQA